MLQAREDPEDTACAVTREECVRGAHSRVPPMQARRQFGHCGTVVLNNSLGRTQAVGCISEYAADQLSHRQVLSTVGGIGIDSSNHLTHEAGFVELGEVEMIDTFVCPTIGQADLLERFSSN